MASALGGHGQPLGASDRAFFEPRLGFDLGRVRIHADENADTAARAVGALAFTHRSDIVFRRSMFQPRTSAGRKLLAHELAHVVQQGAALARKPATGEQPALALGPRLGAAASLQRVSCSLGHLDTECNNAAKTCQAIQDTYCKKKYPTPADIDKLHANATAGGIL